MVVDSVQEKTLTTGITLASWSSGKMISTSVTFVLRRNGVTVPSDQYNLDRANGRVTKKIYDASHTPVVWAFSDTFDATYATYDPATTTTSSTFTNQAQSYAELNVVPGPYDPMTGAVNGALLGGLLVRSDQLADVLNSDGYDGVAKGWYFSRAGDLVAIDSALLMAGTEGFIALGDPPPTSPLDGTGLWIDREGITGLDADVVQALFSAVDGTIRWGGEDGGALTAGGMQIVDGATSTSQIRWVSEIDGDTYNAIFGETGELSLFANTGEDFDLGAVYIQVKDSGGNYVQLELVSDAGGGDQFLALYELGSGNFRGFVINDSIPNLSDGAGLDVNGKLIRIRTNKTPSSASDTGHAGEICADSNYIYRCVATNSWKRAALSTW